MPRCRLLAAAAVLLVPAAALAQEYTVSDSAGGYVTVPEDPVSAERPNGFTTIIGAKRDGVTPVPVTLPFAFQFFGTLHDRITVSEDGWLAFGGATPSVGENPELRRAAAPNSVAAPLWDALRTSRRGSVVTFVKGTAPARMFVVAWQRMDTSDRDSRADVSFQAILHEDTGEIGFEYADDGRYAGLSFTTGIENETGTRAFSNVNLSNLNEDRPPAGARFVPNTVTVRGTVRCEFPRQTAAGLVADAANLLPVSGADVKLVREDASGGVAATALTNALGEFTLLVRGVDGSPTMAVDLFASGAESRVTDATATVYRRRIVEGVEPKGQGASIDVDAVDIAAGVDATDATIRRALSIQQAAQRGFAWVQAAAGGSASVSKAIPSVEIRWVAGSAAPTAYAPASGTTPARITVSDAPANPDAFDTDIVLREYGQHVLNFVAPSPGALASHLFAPAAGVVPTQSETLAFLDGFGWWFACAVLGRAQVLDTRFDSPSPPQTPKADVFDLETAQSTVGATTLTARGANVAGAVAASLWDLCDAVDAADDASDTFDGALPDAAYAVYRAADVRKGARDLPAGSEANTVRRVFDAFAEEAEFDDARSASGIFIHHRTLPDDTAQTNPAHEPNDTPATATPFQAAGQDVPRIANLVLNPFNEDHFTFRGSGAPMSVSVGFDDASEVEVAIFDLTEPLGEALAAGASTPEVRSPVVATTAQPLAAGTTYLARVTWKSGATAHYAVAIANPPVVVTPELATATVGTLYNFDVEVAGGLEPVTLSLDPPVPGLSFAGKRLTGTPTTPGVHHVRLMATDGSDSGPRLAGERDLTVNPRLELLPTFAARADRPFVAVVGRGGTDAAWTNLGGDPPEGFAIDADGTLVVTGSGAAGSGFTLNASATDEAGAVLPSSECDVVLCAPLSNAARTAVAASKPFGYWFDAVEGSRFSATVRFAGEGSRPRFRALLDGAGDALELPAGSVDARGGGIRIAGVTLPATARYFLVFEASAGFAGSVATAQLATRPPTRVAGVAAIATGTTTVDARFTAIAGSHVRVVLRAGRAPNAASPPDAIGLARPGAAAEQIGTARGARGAAVAQFDVTTTGEHVLTIGSGGGTTGPLAYEVVISPPKGAPFELD